MASAGRVGVEPTGMMLLPVPQYAPERPEALLGYVWAAGPQAAEEGGGGGGGGGGVPESTRPSNNHSYQDNNFLSHNISR